MEKSKLKPKERAKIYLEAAEFFQKQLNKNRSSWWELPKNLRQGIGGFCDFLKIKKKNIEIEQFTEYLQFNPKNISHYWFDYNNQSERITALLFSYKMALDAKE